MLIRIEKIRNSLDWELIILVIVISLTGVVAIYSASQNYGSTNVYHYKQLLWLFLGVTLVLTVIVIDFDFILKFAYFYHFAVIVLLVLVLFYGEGNRASNVKRWLNLGIVYIQPSEFAKFTLVLALGRYFNYAKIGNIRWYDLVVSGSLTFIPFFLIFKQPDFGTAAILPIILITVIFMMGLNYKLLFASLVSLLLLIPVVWQILKPYQKDRVLAAFNPESDPLGKGYHLIQSKIAIGSGLIFGKGFFQGKQAQLNFLPAKHTDFIFALFNEEWGFVGGMFLLLLYYTFILKCLSYLKFQKSRTGVVITVGITTIFFSHITINLFMVMGMLPVVGIPLPFFSYGGSSMLSMMLGLAMLLSCVKKQ